MGVGPAPDGVRMDAATRAAIAESIELGLNVDCGLHAEWAIRAGLAFALASPAVSWADLDGHPGLCPDPSAGVLKLHDGDGVASELPGLGPPI